MEKTESGKALGSLAGGDAPVLETLAQMTLDTMPRSGLDARSYFLVRIAGLAALDAAPASYLINTAAAADVLQPKDLQGILIALAPVIGSARTVAAAGNMLKAFATAMDVEDMLQEAQQKEEQLKKH
jgi:4-carboxymuconolactone decarboxylase